MSKKTIFFDSFCGYNLSAVVENGKISQFDFEKKANASIIGNVYKGRVEKVLPGMSAAFVNCGLERNCYLSEEDAFPSADKYDGERCNPLFPELKEGDEIAVQVVKAPVGKKGARVTCFPTFIGKHLIYMPRTPYIGVSRKIKDEELRKNLIYSASKLKEADEGLILRTAAPYATRSQLEIELGYLRNLYASVENSFKSAETGGLLFTDLELPMRVMRDILSYEIERIIVGNKRIAKLIGELMNLYPPQYRSPVILHETGRDMFGEYNLSEQITALTSTRAELDNGAYLVIEKTEALTVIDVNTGKYTGEDSLEQTVYYTNILAAREIARQVRLRNIGGIIVVDFIDMTNAAHKQCIVEELERALKRDSAKCSVSPMSRLGLVEFTRKRTGTSPLSLITKPCRHCKSGYSKSPRFTLIGLRAKLLDLYAEGERLIKIDLNGLLLNELAEWEEFISDMKENMPEAQIYCVPHKSYGDEQLNVRSKDVFPLPEKSYRLI